MKYTEHLQELRRSLSVKEEKKGLKHTINKKCPILPFPTRNPERAKFAEGFSGVTGEFARIVNGNKLESKVSIDDVVEKITEQVRPDEEDQPYFEKLVRSFLVDDLKSMKVFHPHILQYMPLAIGKEAKGEQEIALFIRDVLLQKDEILAGYFEKSVADHLMAKLILENLDHLESSQFHQKYHGLIPEISNLFQEDIIYLAKHREYFINHIHLFLAYYYFFYITQVTLKLNQKQKSNRNTIHKVVYTLDWESTSKNRNGYSLGYKRIKEAARNLLVHVNCLEHLNTLFGATRTMTYPELKSHFEELPSENQEDLLEILRTWITEYRYHTSLPEIELTNTYDDLVTQLFESLKEGVREETKSRYALSIEEVGKKYFLKTRGALGYMLNVTQEFLLLLTAVSIKNERKSLKEVFREFERRGVFFDRYSKEAVVELFDKINILDKKSDSGDAQYVKPIL